MWAVAGLIIIYFQLVTVNRQSRLVNVRLQFVHYYDI